MRTMDDEVTRIAVRVCDACGAQWWGAAKRDVLDDGWKFHDAKRGRMFVMCGDCEARFDRRRSARAHPAPGGGPGWCPRCAPPPGTPLDGVGGGRPRP